MKNKNIDKLTTAIAEAISDNQEKVWVYIGVGYILKDDALQNIIKKAIVKVLDQCA